MANVDCSLEYIASGRGGKLPPKGKLKWFGGNLALSFPVQEDVLNSDGSHLYFSLQELLDQLDDFVGERGGMDIKEVLIQSAFSAYKYNLLTSDEREIFEEFVSRKVGEVKEHFKITPLSDVSENLILSFKLKTPLCGLKRVSHSDA